MTSQPNHGRDLIPSYKTLIRLLGAGLALALLAGPARSAEQTIDFTKQVAPLFEQHCLGCHSPGIRKGDLSLATIADLQSAGFVVPGDPESSYLIDLIAGVNGQPPEMPQDGEPLTADQVEIIRQWIADGAQWPADLVLREQSKADASWWAYQPLAKLTDSVLQQPSTAVDRFIDAKLADRQLARNPPADRGALIRRATYDLTGLPPTPQEVNAFINDDDPAAYEKLLDRLLASPHYGQRWGRHWLDVVRFGESNGFERNVIINNLWPFRDYVIESLNADKPFDQFIREHLAGDVFGSDDPDVAVGTAFLVAGPYDDVGNQDAAQAAQIRANTLDEIISATSQAFLGMTVGCARCHDHKFDPITQEDYYGMYATFAGVRHGAVPLATRQARQQRAEQLKPLNAKKSELQKQLAAVDADVLERARAKLNEYQPQWTRPSIDRTGTEDRFEPVIARFVRLICEAQDGNPAASSGFGIDEFEVWSAGKQSRNVALSINGGSATGPARRIEDFPDAYGPQLAIDGKTGARFIATSNHLTIELSEPTRVDRVLFSSARNEAKPDQRKFRFVAEYRIEVSTDGENWENVASSVDRQPIPSPTFVNHRLQKLETTQADQDERSRLKVELAAVNQQIAAVPGVPAVWIGRRVAADAQGPFHVFVGGSPQKKGDVVTPASLSMLSFNPEITYQLETGADEATRRKALADWITHPDNPLTPRVLANRVWHYHFGTGIVDTPSDFGYMGGRPTHPELLDFLAVQLQQFNWQLKPLHKMIMLSQTYQQSSEFRDDAAQLDGNARLLWRFPPRRLSAEEIRDTMLHIAGKLNTTMGGPGFRLYQFQQDNVCTYVPLDEHGPETYRRAVYHQNARASVVDLMTDFDQPDCAFSTPKRAATTTPLQALTMLNHSFTLDMAGALAIRLKQQAGEDHAAQIRHAYQLCYGRPPTSEELDIAEAFLAQHRLTAFCRVLLNTSELIYVQ